MQNLYDGDSNSFSDHERQRLQNMSNIVTQNKNLGDSFNDDDAAYNIKIQAQVDKNVQYRKDLKEQCEQNYKRTQYNYEESNVAEKHLSEQLHRDYQCKYDDYKIHNDQIDIFNKDCVDYRELEKVLIDVENKRIDRQSNEVSNRSLIVELERERKLKEKDDLNERMCSQMIADEVDRQDRENVMNAKQDDEEREKLRLKDLMAQEKHDENRRELREGLLTQIEENKQIVRDEKRRDLEYRDQAYAVMEMEEEREKERARKKKEADDKYFADLRQQIADNAARRQKEKEDNLL